MSGDLASTGRILIYQNEKGDTKIDVYFEEDTIWMTQRSMAELYQVTPQNITLHIKNIYEDGELSETATCKNYLQVQTEGSRRVRRDTKFYSLDMILAVGYRVRSGVGIHFRRWASRVLTEYMKKALPSMTTGCGSPGNLVRTTLTSCWSVFGISGPAKSGSIRKSKRFSPSRWTMTTKAQSPRIFSNLYDVYAIPRLPGTNDNGNLP